MDILDAFYSRTYENGTFITKFATGWRDLSSPTDRAQALMGIDWEKLDFDDWRAR